MPRYTVNVSYSANGGSGSAGQSTNTVESSANAVSVAVSLSSGSGMTRSGYTLSGWSTSSGGGVSYAKGGTYSYMFANTTFDQTKNVTLYAVWSAITYSVKYNANGGSGAPETQAKKYGQSVTLSSTVPVREGHVFKGWATSNTGSVAYNPGDTYSADASVTLYAVWQKVASEVTVQDANVYASRDVTLRIVANVANASNKLTYSCGSQSGVIASDIAGSATVGGYVDYVWLVPAAIANEMPNSTLTTMIIACETEDQSGNKATSSISVIVKVPNASPFQMTVNLVATILNDNQVIDQWGVAVSGKSKIRLTASAAGQYGASVTSYSITGADLSFVQSTSAASVTVDTNVLSIDGDVPFTVKCYDSRGFAKTATVTVTVHPYHAPSIISMIAYRADANGDQDPVNGRKLFANVVYTISSCDGHNVANADIYYKKDLDSSFTLWINDAASGQDYVSVADVAIANAYEVKCVLTDALQETTVVYTVPIASVIGYAFGIYNDRVHFGGPCKQAGFECDWDADIHGDLNVDGTFNAGSFQLPAPTPAIRGAIYMDSGTDSITRLPNNSVRTNAVTFSVAFSAQPKVITIITSTASGIGRCAAVAANITTTGFDMTYINDSGANADISVTWIAIL